MSDNDLLTERVKEHHDTLYGKGGVVDTLTALTTTARIIAILVGGIFTFAGAGIGFLLILGIKTWVMQTTGQ